MNPCFALFCFCSPPGNVSSLGCVTFLSTTDSTQKTSYCENGLDLTQLKQKPVVILTRLPEFTINALRPPTPQQFYSETESRCSSDSDRLWEPDNDSDSDYNTSGKKRKTLKSKKHVAVKVPLPQMSNNNSHNSRDGSSSSSDNINSSNNVNNNNGTGKYMHLSIHTCNPVGKLNSECLLSITY